MKYAKRLDLKIPTAAYEMRRNTRVIGVDGSRKHGEIFRRYVTREHTEQILSIFPPEIAAANKSVFISSIGPVTPHVHLEEECVINLYIDANNADTIFYEGAIVAINDPELRNTHKYIMSEEKLLKPVESFRAESGEIWVLNTGQPHAVIADDGFRSRWAVQIYLSIPFAETLKYINAG